MIVTITEFAQLARDQNGNVLPLGSHRIGCQELTAAGAFNALQTSTSFVRLATDTGIRLTIDGAYFGYYPPNGVEFKAIGNGAVISFTVAG